MNRNNASGGVKVRNAAAASAPGSSQAQASSRSAVMCRATPCSCAARDTVTEDAAKAGDAARASSTSRKCGSSGASTRCGRGRSSSWSCPQPHPQASGAPGASGELGELGRNARSTAMRRTETPTATAVAATTAARSPVISASPRKATQVETMTTGFTTGAASM